MSTDDRCLARAVVFISAGTSESDNEARTAAHRLLSASFMRDAMEMLHDSEVELRWSDVHGFSPIQRANHPSDDLKSAAESEQAAKMLVQMIYEVREGPLNETNIQLLKQNKWFANLLQNLEFRKTVQHHLDDKAMLEAEKPPTKTTDEPK